MKRLILTLLFLIHFFHIQSFAQKNENKTIFQSLSKYFELPRESVFLHLNKSNFIVGENVWFKGYVYNRMAGKPFNETSNIYIGIYNDSGKQISKKLYYCKNGLTNGNILIDSTFKSGEYYIKASTNWMLNFSEDDSYIQKINIHNRYTLNNTLQDDEDYDVQFFPEGGHLISNISNNLGVKINDKFGRGIKILKGVVKNEKNNIVAEFNTTKFGHGKFSLNPDLNQNYSAELTLFNGNKISSSLPKAIKEGVSIILENKRSDKALIIISTNKFTHKKISNKKFSLLIHRDGFAQKVDFNFPSDKYYKPIVLEKKIFRKRYEYRNSF